MDAAPWTENAALRRAALRLHHIGHAVADIDVSSEQYRSRYGYQVFTPVIHDPLQTARVQFLLLPPDKIYLELVAPDGPGSRLSRSVERGGGLHHLCYSAASLPVAIEVLSLTGMRLISDPKPATAFAGRPICWLMGADRSLVELVERSSEEDLCTPGERADDRLAAALPSR